MGYFSYMEIAVELQKAIEIIEKSDHVGMILPPAPDFDAMASAEAMMRALAVRGKTVGLISPLTGSHIPSSEWFSTLASPTPLVREYIISIDTVRAPLSQLRYENADNCTDIILSPKGAGVQKEAISYREGSVRCDCAMAWGISDPDMLKSELFGVRYNFFTETPLIAADIIPLERIAASVALTDPSVASLSEIAYALISDLPGSVMNSDIATILLAGIINKTDGFKSPGTSPATMLTASGLLHAGAARHTAAALARPPYPLSLLQLAGRAIARSKIDPSGRVLWSRLQVDDFEKTERTADDIPDVLSYMERNVSAHPVNILLWQMQGGGPVRAMLAGNPETLNRIPARMSAAFKSPQLEIKIDFASFHEAELDIAALLGTIL